MNGCAFEFHTAQQDLADTSLRPGRPEFSPIDLQQVEPETSNPGDEIDRIIRFTTAERVFTAEERIISSWTLRRERHMVRIWIGQTLRLHDRGATWGDKHDAIVARKASTRCRGSNIPIIFISRVTNRHHIEIQQNIEGAAALPVQNLLAEVTVSARCQQGVRHYGYRCTRMTAPIPGWRCMTSTNAHDLPETGASNVNGLRVLLVEDSWQVGAGLKFSLEAYGIDVVGPVATTADAVRVISERTIDVAVVDLRLRGGELAYGLIDQLYDRGIRIVVLTGYADPPLKLEKVAAVLQKPVQGPVLLRSLRR